MSVDTWTAALKGKDIYHEGELKTPRVKGLNFEGAGVDSVEVDTQSDQVTVTINGGVAGTDGTAIHDNVAGEIAAIATKVTPVAGDFLIIEDSAAGNAKKKVTVGSLPGGSGSATATLRNAKGVFLTNVASLSGLAQTADGSIAINTDGDVALLTAQSTASQNGPWVVHSGAWTRPTDFAAGEDAAGVVVVVQQGSTGTNPTQDSLWLCTSNTGSAVIGTNNLSWVQLPSHLATTAPVDVTKAAAALGTSTRAAKEDHKHDISTAAPVAIGTANAQGSATSLARSDHVHDHGAQTATTLHAVAGTGAGFMPGNYYDTQQLITSSATVADGDDASATALSFTPRLGRFPRVFVDGIRVTIGSLTAEAYFSADGGTTARANGAVASADTLHWNGSVAGWELASGQSILIEQPA